MNILNGKKVRKELINSLKKKLKKIDKQLGLAVIQVGDNKASNLYVWQKEKLAKELGYKFEKFNLAESVSETTILTIIEKLNKDKTIDGIIIHMPLPSNLDSETIQNKIIPEKDVDGLTETNQKKLANNTPYLIPCTPQGIIDIFKYYNIDYIQKNIVILGRSSLVGTPLYNILKKINPNVTLCHSKTPNISTFTKTADILITAIGKPNYIKKEMVKEGVIIIDAGINFAEGKLYGDADYNDLKDKVSYITPVPGGVGQMTTIELCYNVYKAYCLKNKIKY